MLLRPDATFVDYATNRAERIFPQGSHWLHFESKLPGREVFANSVLDPAIGLSGDLGIKSFASADWGNFISSTQIGLFELGTRVGIPTIPDIGITDALSRVYHDITTSLDAYQNFEHPETIVADLVTNAGLQVLQQLGQNNMVAQTVAQVLAAAVWAAGVIAEGIHAELGKDVPLPPLQTEDPTVDSWQVNRVFEVFRSKGSGGIVYPDGKIEPASNADYTQLFLPAYDPGGKWQIQHRKDGVAAQQGSPTKARGPRGETEYRFDPKDASTFGFMPGTTTTLRVLQASYRFYQTPRGTAVDRYALRCKGVNKPCYQSPKAFNGKRDCRQCVTSESVWPTKGIGWAYGGVQLNATTPGENVGAFYPSTNKLLLNILDMIARPGPLLYTIDPTRMMAEWRASFELFWDFARGEWKRHRAPGWRGLISRLATLMTALEHDGDVVPGGRDPQMPLSLIADPREGEFSIPFSSSIYARIIRPYCKSLERLQRYYLTTLSVAYVPPGAGALYDSSGRVRRNALGDAFDASRRALLNSTKRVLVDLRLVADPEYRAALANAGVKPSPVNSKLLGSPGLGHEILVPDIKPPRAIEPPRAPLSTAFDSVVRLSAGRSQRLPRASSDAEPIDRRVVGAAIAGLGALAGTGAAVAWYRAIRQRAGGDSRQ